MPHFVFHLSKRLFSEAALKSQVAAVHHKHLNIFSSEYVDEAIQLISTKNRGCSIKTSATAALLMCEDDLGLSTE